MATEETVAKAVRPYPPQHEGEAESNRVREQLSGSEPLCQRTYTPSLAVLQRSAGAYHWTPEGRRLWRDSHRSIRKARSLAPKLESTGGGTPFEAISYPLSADSGRLYSSSNPGSSLISRTASLSASISRAESESTSERVPSSEARRLESDERRPTNETRVRSRRATCP